MNYKNMVNIKRTYIYISMTQHERFDIKFTAKAKT